MSKNINQTKSTIPCVYVWVLSIQDLRENCAKTAMDIFGDEDPFGPCSIKDHQKVENVHDHLEDGWFFGKLLSTNPRSTIMLRCFSEPSPNFSQEFFSENSSTMKALAGNNKNNLIRAPSLPPLYIGRREETEQESGNRGIKKQNKQLSDQSLVQDQEIPIQKPIGFCTKKIEDKESDGRREKLIKEQPLKHKMLLRTPSVPPSLGRERAASEEEEIEENDCDITISRLIRQAMPHTSKVYY